MYKKLLSSSSRETEPMETSGWVFVERVDYFDETEIELKNLETDL